MKNLTAIVVNGLKKAVTRFTNKRHSRECQSIEEINHPENEVVTQDISIQQVRLRQVATGIKALMDEQKIYENPQLALRELSCGLNMPSYIVTKAINEVLGVNFYDLVNRYRVEEAKQPLTNPKYDRYTILRVASDAGFNSKTTFNTVFRKFTGVTPSYYRTTCRIAMDVRPQELVTYS